ncbi:Ras and Rab interactor-like protein [Camelus dromedarius]|uniref:Ras and Rab interactor-like protein n=1 Tax=Camelus dromedarius TaxID=9838 RepID=A0A5N4DQA7_CAMDR|nr:Ras and Rab interactor-like protein [Camelus dromedarius]
MRTGKPLGAEACSIHHPFPRLVPSQANRAGETPLGILRTPETLLRLQRTWGVWQIPELDAQDAKALLKLWPPGVSVSLESSNLCMPDLPHLLAFLSASRDVLPRTLLLPPLTLEPVDQHTDTPQTGSSQLSTSGRVLFVVNKLYLETHRTWGMEQMPPETPSETAERPGPG